MALYKLEKLIEETRRIASEYRDSTGQTLPVTPEIARHDAISKLELEPAEQGVGFDAIGLQNGQSCRYLVKGRVIFDENKSGQRIGQLNMDAAWDAVLLVLLNEQYETTEIFCLNREEFVEAGADPENRRGAMTVARFRNVGHLVWDRWSGLDAADVCSAGASGD